MQDCQRVNQLTLNNLKTLGLGNKECYPTNFTFTEWVVLSLPMHDTTWVICRIYFDDSMLRMIDGKASRQGQFTPPFEKKCNEIYKLLWRRCVLPQLERHDWQPISDRKGLANGLPGLESVAVYKTNVRRRALFIMHENQTWEMLRSCFKVMDEVLMIAVMR